MATTHHTERTAMNPDTITMKQLLQLADTPKPRDMNDRLVGEVKYDGHRIAMYRTETGVRTFARSGAEKSGLLQRAEAAMMALPAGTWVDGEACSFKDGSELANDWGVAQSVLGSDSVIAAEAKITYVVFDMMSFDGNDMRSLPMSQRRAFMEQVFETLVSSDAMVLSTQYAADEVKGKFDEIVAAGGEGMILKDPATKYASGKRGAGWWKLKFEATEDVVLMGATPGKGKFAGMIGALVFGQYDAAGNLVEKGQCSGMNDDLRAEFTDAFEAGTLNGTVIEVKHYGIMPTGGWRHPNYLRTRTDKPARDCVAR